MLEESVERLSVPTELPFNRLATSSQAKKKQNVDLTSLFTVTASNMRSYSTKYKTHCNVTVLGEVGEVEVGEVAAAAH